MRGNLVVLVYDWKCPLWASLTGWPAVWSIRGQWADSPLGHQASLAMNCGPNMFVGTAVVLWTTTEIDALSWAFVAARGHFCLFPA
jgi:hypothetical protein